MTIADDLREQYHRRQLASKALSRCVLLAKSVGVLADQGKLLDFYAAFGFELAECGAWVFGVPLA